MIRKLVLSICIFMMVSIIATPAAFANTIIIIADQSSRTKIQTPDDNATSGDKLTVRRDPKAQKSWIKFLLGNVNVGSLETATLTIALHDPKTGDNYFDVSYVNDDCNDNIDWTETSITWNNAPGNNTADVAALDPSKTTLLATPTFTNGVSGESFTIDVLKALKTDTDGIIQFVIHNSSLALNFATHDHPEEAWRPFLTLEAGLGPTDAAVEISRNSDLRWLAEDRAAAYDVYFGVDFNDVNEATRENPLSVLVSENQEESTYSFPEDLEPNQTYYWRIDDINEADPNSPWKGDIWRFTTGDHVTIDDFEAYNDINEDEEGSNRIYNTWSDGYVVPPAVPTNGSTIGYPDPDFANGEHFVETVIVYGGSQSGPFLYNNTTVSYSEVTLPMSATALGSNWAQGDFNVLTLWFYGDPNNPATESLYVKLNSSKVAYSGEAVDLSAGQWVQWDINLSDFAGLNLASVTKFTVGTERAGATGSEGILFLDNIRVRSVVE